MKRVGEFVGGVGEHIRTGRNGGRADGAQQNPPFPLHETGLRSPAELTSTSERGRLLRRIALRSIRPTLASWTPSPPLTGSRPVALLEFFA